MQLRCPHCTQVLEFTTQHPRFCSLCGSPLGNPALEPTVHYDAGFYDPDPTRLLPFGPGHPATAPPESVGGYRLLRPIGSGGMGTVYEAEETSSHRRVALKLIRPEFAASADALERFRREGRLASTIVHPRCVFVLAADEEAGRPYIVMELMPGETLADLVARRGPLPPREAVTLILDVIEGLQEAHRCGLVHRDVKPSNCFLDAEGRVKIGDFGLAKSLLNRQDGLTQTGSFLGTVLYAAPEQIRNDKVDRQADVYSVAATLYFLLTGKAPFETDDPAASLARALSDPLTPMCQLRRDLPRTLDEVVLRGLARPRERRWPGLEPFRLALLPFVPGTHAVGEIGWRFAAYVVDSFALIFLEFVLLSGFMALVAAAGTRVSAIGLTVFEAFLSLAAFLLWFAVPEKVWGCSVGKALFRLRVRGVRTDDRPSWAASVARTLFFWLLKDAAPRVLDGLVLLYFLFVAPDEAPDLVSLLFNVSLLAVPELARLAGAGLIAATMRRRNGFRGLHEFLSFTKVIRLPRKDPDRFLRGPDAAPPAATAVKDLPERLGAFTIRAALRSGPSEQVLLGVDEVLDRQVWLWVRPADGVPFQARRREIGRTTRPRWLAGGRDGDRAWDAFVASPGCLLADLVKGRRRLFWPETRPVLEQLAEELNRSCDEGTLPPSLGVEQIWVQGTGRVQLLDTPLRDRDITETVGGDPRESDDQRRGLTLLRQTAILLLEGRPTPPPAARPLRAPVPSYAVGFLARLAGVERPFASVREFQAELQAVGDRPPAVSRTRRGVALVLQAALLFFGVACMLPISLNLTYGTYGSSYLFPKLVGEIALEDLEDDAGRREATLRATADPVTAAFLRRQTEDDLRIQARLRDDVRYMESRRVAALGSSSWFVRHALDRVEKGLKDGLRMGIHTVNGPQKADYIPIEITPDSRRNAANVHRLLVQHRDAGGVITWREAIQGTAPLLVWPALWLFWSGLTRGGLCLPVTGIAVVQVDGRRAARWRCVARAALVWAPFVVLLLVSLLLDLWRVAASGTSATAAELHAAAWLAWLTWWLAVAWLPLHLLLALLWPNRGWHDWLAGTFLVPR